MIEKPSTPATQTAVNGAKATTMAVSVKVATLAMAESAVTGKAVTVTEMVGDKAEDLSATVKRLMRLSLEVEEATPTLPCRSSACARREPLIYSLVIRSSAEEPLR